MTDDKSKITYDEGWQSVSSSEYPKMVADFDGNNYSEKEYYSANSDDNMPQAPKKHSLPSQLLITIQLILCIIIALLALILKGVGGDTYSAAHDWYYSNLNNSAIFDDKSVFDIQKLFSNATKDEI